MKGILLYGGRDKTIEKRAKTAGLKLERSETYSIPFDKTLIVRSGTRVPWDLLPAAWHFVERWDAAIPLWRYGVTAADVGTAEERQVTQAVIRDLRVLLHSVELLFVRRSKTGVRLVEVWQSEGGDQRLAFLRALYQVKPRLCVLPTSWLAKIQQRSQQTLHGFRRHPRSPNAGRPLVTVELEPGRLVKCHAGDEEKVLAQFERQRKAR